MRRPLVVAQPLPHRDGWDARLAEDPGDWLPGARPAGPGRWRLSLRAGRQLARPVEASVGDPWRDGWTLSRSLSWEPITTDLDPVDAGRVLPSFDGELLLVGPDASPSLVVTGDVRLPLGWLGGVLDGLLLARLGDRAVADLLVRIAAAGAVPAGHRTAAHQRSSAPSG